MAFYFKLLRMKKLIISISLLFGLSLTANSQVLISLLLGDKLNSDGLEFGLEGGFNWSTISAMSGKQSMDGFNLGFYFDIRIKNQYSLYTGVLVKGKLGIDNLKPDDLEFLETSTYSEEGTYSQVINYFMVPALIKYNLKNRIYFELGPQVGLMHNAWVEYNAEPDSREARIKDFNKEDINRIDFGAIGGFGYKIKKTNGMTFGVKYYYGFTDVYKSRSGSNNESIFLKFNIPIGAGKAEEASENKPK